MRLGLAILAISVLLMGCVGGGGGYNIRDGRVQDSMLEGVNALRITSGQAPLVTDPALVAAGMRHAQDMSRQGRPWNWGSDGSSPIQRAYEAGYTGVFLTELISESFESETDTLAAWFSDPVLRDAILDSRAVAMGLGYHKDVTGKIWWALEIGG